MLFFVRFDIKQPDTVQVYEYETFATDLYDGVRGSA
jgi:hypothetical protein